MPLTKSGYSSLNESIAEGSMPIRGVFSVIKPSSNWTFLITIFFVLFFPILAFGFFLGYGLHLFVDSFTIRGIKPFYPLKKKCSGKIKTGGRIEVSLFVFFLLADLFLLFFRIYSLF